jgi:carbamate kinase
MGEATAGSMGPKVDAACHFAETTGKAAAIGALNLAAFLRGKARTTISASAAEITWAG